MIQTHCLLNYTDITASVKKYYLFRKLACLILDGSIQQEPLRQTEIISHLL